MMGFDHALVAKAIERLQREAPTDDLPQEELREAMRLLGRAPSVLSGNSQTLEEKWFSSSGDISPYHWTRHFNHKAAHMGDQGTSIMTKIGLDADRIMDELPDPRPKDAEFDCRGLVVGSVQSGKTANFTALMSKAADAGYDLVIVLAGLIDDLREQTQERLNRELTGLPGKTGGGWIPRDEDKNKRWWNLTDRASDFNKETEEKYLAVPAPKLIVMKKNHKRLKRLHHWLDKNPKKLPRRRVLIIDDEADHASINTGILGKFKKDELRRMLTDRGIHVPSGWTKQDMVDGLIAWRKENGDRSEEVPDEDASETNKLIRRLLKRLPAVAYVGYTATPFANLLTSPWPRQQDLGDTLYPRDFVASIEAPEEYLGARHFFSLVDAEDDNRFRLVNVEGDSDEEDPPRDDEAHITAHLLLPLPDVDWHRAHCRVHSTLADAIGDFLVTGIVRKLRGQGDNHHTMLINTSHLNDEQEIVQEKVEELIGYWRDVLHYPKTDPDAKPVRKLLRERFRLMRPLMTGHKPSWRQVEHFLDSNNEGNYIDTLAEVASINYRTGQKLEYLEKPEGLRIIAIGGNRLSRGLTLEGLTISYFLRSSTNYDTLLQMGRWFGYRPGYDDLVRVHLSGRLINWFEHLSKVETQIRADISRYEQDEVKRTPRDLAVRIQTHPIMQVSGRFRAIDTNLIRSGYDGEILKTLRFSQKASVRRKNLALGSTFFSKLPMEGYEDKHSIRLWKSCVEPKEVADLISKYKTSEELLGTFSPKDVSKYIREMAKRGELSNWSVGIHIPGKNRKGELEFGGSTIGTVNRGPVKGTPQIGILEHQFKIFGVDIDGYPGSVTDENGEWDGGQTMWPKRGVDEPLLLIYLIDRESKSPSSGKPLFADDSEHGMAIAMVIPRSHGGADLRKEFVVVAGVAYD